MNASDEIRSEEQPNSQSAQIESSKLVIFLQTTAAFRFYLLVMTLPLLIFDIALQLFWAVTHGTPPELQCLGVAALVAWVVFAEPDVMKWWARKLKQR
jgi:hypothetical protein